MDQDYCLLLISTLFRRTTRTSCSSHSAYGTGVTCQPPAGACSHCSARFTPHIPHSARDPNFLNPLKHLNAFHHSAPCVTVAGFLQVKYVVELARTMAFHPMVYRVDLLTRLITNESVAPDYGKYEERITELNPEEPLQGAFIVRIRAGNPDVYIPKESLWPHVRECAP
jgi:hypothetical protein